MSSSKFFDPVQKFFNGNFWEVFEKKFGKFTKENVLDIACGTGELKRHITPKKYLGIDINSSYIKLCRDNFRIKNVMFEKTDATKFVLNDKFDTVFFVGSIHHFSDKQVVRVFNNLNNKKAKKIIICDGVPFGILKKPLIWLDGYLGGGKYFRSEASLTDTISKFFKIKKQGRLVTDDSFYYYPYWILQPLQK